MNATVSSAPISFLRLDREDFEGYVAHVVRKAPAPVRLANGHYVFLFQRLGLRREERFLTTLEYGYWYQSDESEDTWIVRYEYQREPELPYRYPRSHVHVNAEPANYRGDKPFAQLHLPTGQRVTLEGFLRHLIEEHGVPAISPNWEAVLAETEAEFAETQKKRLLDPAST